MLWQWLTVIALSMTPALIAGQSAACAAGMAFGWSPWRLLPVVATASFVEGLIVIKLAELSVRVPWLRRHLARWHKPSAVAWCQRWGPWGGLMLGVAVVGIEPILIALKWMDVDSKKLVLPLAISSVLFTVLYYVIVAFGWAQASRFGDVRELVDLLLE